MLLVPLPPLASSDDDDREDDQRDEHGQGQNYQPDLAEAQAAILPRHYLAAPSVEQLLAMDWDDPAHRPILEMEGLKRWARPELDGYASLFEAVREKEHSPTARQISGSRRRPGRSVLI